MKKHIFLMCIFSLFASAQAESITLKKQIKSTLGATLNFIKQKRLSNFVKQNPRISGVIGGGSLGIGITVTILSYSLNNNYFASIENPGIVTKMFAGILAFLGKPTDWTIRSTRWNWEITKELAFRLSLPFRWGTLKQKYQNLENNYLNQTNVPKKSKNIEAEFTQRIQALEKELNNVKINNDNLTIKNKGLRNYAKTLLKETKKFEERLIQKYQGKIKDLEKQILFVENFEKSNVLFGKIEKILNKHKNTESKEPTK